MSGSFAIEVSGVSKTFLIPHEQRARLKEYFAHPFKRTAYERNEVLRDVTFQVEEGEFFGIVGPNGTGKSTLLKVLAGIYRADAGTVRVNGRLSPFIELGVGFNPEFSARTNVEISGVLIGLTRKEVAERFDSIIEFAGLERFVDQQLKNYSSGMLLRLAYSVAIQVPFDILLLDEALAVGDAEFQQKCFETFAQMRAQGKTVVFVSHDLGSVSRFCDRAMLLESGRIGAIGDVGEVIDAYRPDEFVAV
ncbi:MAG TPA: ABC transporter ATP-binding protein [Gaiellaceae bacterium]|jgi:ABC-type polysaccharide/polyol phosphate transport system ATPase subunit|nr:ABC transporter ATP-binding protein [Gaiellaceae bacterium]